MTTWCLCLPSVSCLLQQYGATGSILPRPVPHNMIALYCCPFLPISTTTRLLFGHSELAGDVNLYKSAHPAQREKPVPSGSVPTALAITPHPLPTPPLTPLHSPPLFSVTPAGRQCHRSEAIDVSLKSSTPVPPPPPTNARVDGHTYDYGHA